MFSRPLSLFLLRIRAEFSNERLQKCFVWDILRGREFCTRKDKKSSMNDWNVNDWNRQVVEQFRSNGGKVSGRYEGASLLLLTTIGKKSGEPRIAPLGYQMDGDRYIVVASYLGAAKHPDWYYNLVAHPQVTVEIGEERFEAIATTVDDAERERLLKSWPMVVEHQAKTERQIPFVALQRVQ